MKIIVTVTPTNRVIGVRQEQDNYELREDEREYQGDPFFFDPLNQFTLWDGRTVQLNTAGWRAYLELKATDAAMMRTTEDLIDTLVAGKVIRLEELPAKTQQHYADKKAKRKAYTG